MRKKRIVALTLSSLVAIGVLGGCGASNEEAKSDTSNSGTTAEGKLEPVKLKYYTIGAPPKDLAIVNEKINEYTKEKINAELEINFIDWGDYTEKMQMKSNSGEEFDLAFTCSWAYDYQMNARKGAFLDITDMIQEYGKDMLEVIHPQFIEGNKIDGKLYAVPTNKELGQQRVLRWNKKYVDKYNIDITKYTTFESLEPVFAEIKAGEPSLKTILRPPSPDTELALDLSLNGAIAFDMEAADPKFEIKYENEKYKQFLDTMRKYYEAGYIRSDQVAYWASGSSEEDKSGEWVVDVATTQPYADYLWSSGLGYEVVSQPMTVPYTLNTSVSGSMVAVSSTSKNPERAVMFLNLLNTDEYLRNLVNYGVEGTHYTKLDGPYIEQTQQGVDNYNVPAFSLGNVFLTYMLPGTPEDKWEKFEEFNDSSVPSKMLGFSFDSAPVKNEIATINSVTEEFNNALVSGSVNPNEHLPKAVEKLKAAGIDKVIAEMQKQYDAWKK